MGRAEFEYDEVGNTFYYVLVSFYAIILLPASYFFFPSFKQVEEKVDDRICQCHGCVEKRKRKQESQPFKKAKKAAAIVILFIAWIIFILICWKVVSIENTHVEYNPYAILELDQGANTASVKKAYRELSKKFHPDKGGDPAHFDRIAKAYQALTDEESRKNWEEYGNPDGPTATTFGIALPKWLVSKEYGLWVLAFYGLVFMIILPVGVGYWWYNSIKYSVDKVLLDTTQLFGYFLRKTPRMEIHRALMILGGAFEFNKDYNNEIVLRQTDDTELPRLMKHLQHLGENKKERPMCLPYALKARILIHAHITRLPLDSEGLLFDQRYSVIRCYRLIEEMLSIAQQISYYTSTKIPVETLDNLLRLLPMFVQSIWPKNSTLLQLPHLGDHNIPYLRRQKVMNCSGLAALEHEPRRKVLNSLSDAQYRDVVLVLTSMPRLHIETTFEVPGEEDAHEVTAGCFVTLKVKLTRRSLLDPAVAGEEALRMGEDEAEKEEDEDEKEATDDVPATPEEPVKKRKVWEKQQPKKKGGAKKKAGFKPKKAVPVAEEKEEEKEVEKAKKEKEEEEDEASSAEDEKDDDESDEASGASPNNDESDDDGWVAETKKPVLEAKSHETHPVHCPFYPGEKFEWWWLVLTNSEKKGARRLVCPVVSCKTLVDSQTVEMRFAAPDAKGSYVLNLAVHSDSYMDCDYSIDIKLEVKEAAAVVVSKYEDTEDEEDDDASAASSSEYTEDDDDE